MTPDIDPYEILKLSGKPDASDADVQKVRLVGLASEHTKLMHCLKDALPSLACKETTMFDIVVSMMIVSFRMP
jgi:hypothetical protein